MAVRGKKRVQGRRSIELIEEAVHMLRRAPAGVLARYYIGALPFVFALLYFWTDMSRNAYAVRHVEAASLGLALLYFWMKVCQASFCRRLTAWLRNEPPPRARRRKYLAAVLVQVWWHALGLIVLPISLVLAFPFAWSYAFFQNMTVLGFEGRRSPGRTAGRAWRQALLWPMSNHAILSILTLFGLFAALNLIMTIFTVPYLLKSLLGIETFMTVTAWYMLFNTTLLAVVSALVYVCLDPLVKAVYTLRCFYGASVGTGEDLRVELAGLDHLKKYGALALAAVLLGGLLLAGPAASRAELAGANVLAAGGEISPEKLGRSIQEVLRQREYAWRMPRDEGPEVEVEDKGLIGGAMKWIAEKFRAAGRTLDRWMDDLRRWMKRLMPEPKPLPGNRTGSGIDWRHAIDTILIVVLVMLLGAGAIIFYRSWRRRRQKEDEIEAEAVAAEPDVEDESVGAEELPGEEWLAMANRLMEEGNLRLALRALYLATLARLAEHGMIGLARYKSNQDYARELARRTAGSEEIPTVFSENVGLFDRAWYGGYEVTPGQVRRFAANQERIMAGVIENYGRTVAPPTLGADRGRP